MVELKVNGRSYQVDVEPETPLLWALRENVGLTGTKYGCGVAQCGSCTVHVDGQPVRSCTLQVGDAAGKQITTIEGLAAGATMHKVQKAWIEHDVPQCGYLPERHDHGRGGATQREAQADRRRHRRGDHQHLPLRHLPAGARGDPRRGQGVRETAMTIKTQMKRRTFLIGAAAAGGGLALGLDLPFGPKVAQASAESGPEVTAWVVIKPDDTVVIRIARSEMGQGTLDRARAARAEELECDWSKVTTEYPDARAERREQARVGRFLHRRQPRHPRIARIRAQGRRHGAR
jgi:hypothetical protein